MILQFRYLQSRYHILRSNKQSSNSSIIISIFPKHQTILTTTPQTRYSKFQKFTFRYSQTQVHQNDTIPRYRYHNFFKKSIFRLLQPLIRQKLPFFFNQFVTTTQDHHFDPHNATFPTSKPHQQQDVINQPKKTAASQPQRRNSPLVTHKTKTPIATIIDTSIRYFQNTSI